jgi:hypothetical protein
LPSQTVHGRTRPIYLVEWRGGLVARHHRAQFAGETMPSLTQDAIAGSR